MVSSPAGSPRLGTRVALGVPDDDLAAPTRNGNSGATRRSGNWTASRGARGWWLVALLDVAALGLD